MQVTLACYTWIIQRPSPDEEKTACPDQPRMHHSTQTMPKTTPYSATKETVKARINFHDLTQRKHSAGI
ncbi:hypothetical protein FUT69_03930 [Xylella taiwanensis]|uniref:Transposase n=1 Tax=Xylella taiwanensis TaxID=1444770 RepID=A0ABS8TRN9_9GAMM|nr:hypothetical protein [Xylella taiwanensis]MCD8455343.1 hypothetical protein [Xylella taiwanensis]MCD8457748.1 hypothetical protein [Xylella taiwanensis]MCD8459883.1 hypothetical protein [Xylella taiwanensis]MCD8464388.1 hypothetical protein [Xylella taiwanensis]MCD8469607.1 hypothetical protein [Xylella taiwanensis]